MQTINIGELLSNYCNRKRIYKSGLARKMGMNYQSILRHLKSPIVSLDTLLKFCEGLEHNFLMDIATQLPKTYTTDAPIDTTAINEIEALKEKIKLLEKERDVLLKVIEIKAS